MDAGGTVTAPTAGTLPVTPAWAEHRRRSDRVPFEGDPTWARRHVGGGQCQRVPLHPWGVDDDGRQVWVVAADDSTAGDRVEIGPTGPDVRVVVEMSSHQLRGGTRW